MVALVALVVVPQLPAVEELAATEVTAGWAMEGPSRHRSAVPAAMVATEETEPEALVTEVAPAAAAVRLAGRAAHRAARDAESQCPPSVTRSTSSTVVRPLATLRMPSSRRETMPRSMHMRRNADTFGLPAIVSRSWSSTHKSS